MTLVGYPPVQLTTSRSATVGALRLAAAACMVGCWWERSCLKGKGKLDRLNCSRRRCRRARATAMSRFATAPDSPGQLLRLWRKSKRDRIVTSVVDAWSRTDSLPRGEDAGFVFQNVGPLVGHPPALWIYFVGGFCGTGANETSVADTTRHFFEKACDATQSYTLLNCSSGCVLEPGSTAPPNAQLFESNKVFSRYDLVVACDKQSEQHLAACVPKEELMMQGQQRFCCLDDFVDTCGEKEQTQQLECLLATRPTDVAAAVTICRTARFLQTALPGLQDGTAASQQSGGRVDSMQEEDVLLEAARALAAAGLERFLISQFPVHLKDRLHPLLVPEGLEG
eukprot:CAMPEP_0172761944 /NCGR_PEP_ID=MMETSP1074-20121228/172517_1 /TAXON_ID=2916 /ORGANISM="Ceratium fusus, Strain PA161109" /LENGTH=338 /DNA_ID=CAMNT_0013596247 /DNA_START=30 /DNA_END=1046 /DNA_ORIENTATION=-